MGEQQVNEDQEWREAIGTYLRHNNQEESEGRIHTVSTEVRSFLATLENHALVDKRAALAAQTAAWELWSSIVEALEAAQRLSCGGPAFNEALSAAKTLTTHYAAAVEEVKKVHWDLAKAAIDHGALKEDEQPPSVRPRIFSVPSVNPEAERQTLDLGRIKSCSAALFSAVAQEK